MKSVIVCASLLATLAACSSSDPQNPITTAGTDSGTDGGHVGPVVDSSAPVADSATDSDVTPDAGGDTPGGGDCSAARAQLLGSVNSVATGAVSVLSSNAAVTTIYIDASAGGIGATTPSPWTYVDLATGTKAAFTDTTSLTSTGWDLAIKRPALYTNSGDGGPGTGGAVLLTKDFDAVTTTDATAATFATESFFDASCNPNTDPTGSAMTTLSTWYDYNSSTHMLTPAAGTWLVRGGTGKIYKVAIETYYGTPDGGVGTGDGGTYVIKVGTL